MEELIEIVEGRVRLLVYNPDRFRRADGVYEPAWAPVFYNPQMTINRDYSVLNLAALNPSNAIVVDALAGSGVRALRYCAEVAGVERCFANDIDSKAYDLVRRNIELNGLSERVRAYNEDANVLLYRLKLMGERLDFVDVDPYGSPAPFTRSATWAVARGGYVGLTATDIAALSGSKPWAGSRRYWASLAATDVPKVVALRVLLGYAARVAAELDRYIEPLSYLLGRHFVRVMYRVRKGASAADAMLARDVGYLRYCEHCGFRDYVGGFESPTCPNCGDRVRYIGPLWIGRVAHGELVARAKELLLRDYTYLQTREELLRVLEFQVVEAEVHPQLPYDIVHLSSWLKVNAPKVSRVVDCLRSLGYRSVRYYGVPTAICTDAPYKDVVSCIRGPH
jgi:tRNA (guanine26-N2/guanine27-N2)-dimethyltransferase